MKLDEFFEKLGRWTVRRSVPIIAASTVMSLIALLGASKLGMDTDLANMLPEGNAVAQSYTRIGDAFESTSSVIMVLQGPDRETLIASAQALEKAIASAPEMTSLVRTVDWRLDRDFAEQWGLLTQDADDLADTDRVFRNIGILPMLRATNDLLEENLSDGSDEEVSGPDGERDAALLMSRLGLFARSFREAVSASVSAGPPKIDKMADAWLFGDEYMVDPEERTLLMIVRPSFDIGDRAKLRLLSDGLTALGDSVLPGFTGVTLGLTGDAENEAAEERAMSADVLYPSLVAIAIIAVMFFFSFKRLRSIGLALVALVVGLLWDIGFAGFAVGSLNMITSSFGALLIGLGIDFGIHISSRFEDELRGGFSAEDSMGRAFKASGFPVVIGGVTTAIAFYMLFLSRTPAFREFALIAGTGILTTLASAMVLLPSLLSRLAHHGPSAFPNRPLLGYTFAGRCVSWASRRRIIVLPLAAVSLALLYPGIARNGFEYDMRKIGPQGTAAQRYEREVETRFGISTWQHVAMAPSLEEAAALAELYGTAPLVSYVESAADYVPSAGEQAARLGSIARMKEGFDAAAGSAGSAGQRTYGGSYAGDLMDEIQRLEWNVIELGDLAAASLGEGSLPVRKRAAMIREIFGAEEGKPGEEVFANLRDAIGNLSPETAIARLGEIDGAFRATVADRYGRLLSVARPVTVQDLPDSIRSEFVSPDGTGYLVRIVPSAGLSGEAAFKSFAEGLEATAPGATGTLVLGLALSREVLSEAARLAIFVAIAVFALVGLGFASWKSTAVVLGGFAVAVFWTFSTAPYFGKFNIVSSLSLPLIIGIGVDYCVHVVTALRSENPESVAHTSRAMTLSMLTTLIGFGSLALVGSFQGIAALGTTLSLGIVASYVAAIIVIPALMGSKNIVSGGKKNE